MTHWIHACLGTCNLQETHSMNPATYSLWCWHCQAAVCTHKPTLVQVTDPRLRMRLTCSYCYHGHPSTRPDFPYDADDPARSRMPCTGRPNQPAAAGCCGLHRRPHPTSSAGKKGYTQVPETQVLPGSASISDSLPHVECVNVKTGM